MVRITMNTINKLKQDYRMLMNFTRKSEIIEAKERTQ